MIVERIYEWAERQPAKTAVIWNDRSLSYPSFSNAIRSACDFFKRENLPVGGTAIVLVRGLLDTWIIVMALRALGLNTIPVRSVEQTQSLKISSAACIITTQAEAATHDLAASAATANKLVVIPSPVEAIKDTDALLPFQHDMRPFGGHILYTSGTTGTYKKVLLSGELEDRRNQVRAQLYSFDTGTIYHGVDFELWTGTGFKTSSAVWHAGGCVVLDEREKNFANFFSHGINFAKLLPWQLRKLLREVRRPFERPLDGFALSVGGGFLPVDLADQFVQELKAKLIVNYSATEINSVRLHSHYASKDDLFWLLPTDQTSVQIVNQNGGECAVNEEGELRIVLSDIDCHHYLDDEEASAKVFRNGFFYPGDIAVKREDGRIRILGRVADVIVLKGEKLATAPIEQEIQRDLQAEEVCLFSGLGKQGEEKLVIAIQSKREIAPSRLEAIAGKFPRFEKVWFSKNWTDVDNGNNCNCAWASTSRCRFPANLHLPDEEDAAIKKAHE